LLNPDESLFLAGFAVDEVTAVVTADVLSTQSSRPAPEIATRFGRRNHVEGHRQRSAFIDVVHPQTGPGKLPLHVTVRLKQPPVYQMTTRVAVWLSGNIVGRVNEVALRRAGLVPRWVTVNQATQLNSAFHPSGGDKSSTGLLGWGEGGARKLPHD